MTTIKINFLFIYTVNLRSYLINNANTALINARNRLHEVGNNVYEQAQDQGMKIYLI